MSNPNVCRDCEYKISEDAELCYECAENKFVDLMRDDRNWRSELFSGEYTFNSIEGMDEYTLAVFEAWCAKDPETAGKIIFDSFDKAFSELRLEGAL